MTGAFKFIDLFAGIGGTRKAFERLGGECIFASEKDPIAREVYYQNYHMVPQGDITVINQHSHKIGYPNILVAGFPCQPFSSAGKRLGFGDERGSLFYYIADILEAKKPEAFFLENVKGLLSNDRGNTIKEILRILREELDYYVPDPQIVNAKDFGIPQNRERLFIVGFRKDLGITEFEYPKPLYIGAGTPLCLRPVLETCPVSNKYYLSEGYLDCLKKHKVEQKKKGRGFGFEILDPDKDIANTLTVGGMGRERNLIVDNGIKDRTPVTRIHSPINKQNVRKLTPRECARLMGFDDSFTFDGVADVNAYRLFGNSVVIDAVYYTGQKMIEKLESVDAFRLNEYRYL